MNITAIIAAAGPGTRLGASSPKGFVRLHGRSLFLYSLEVLLSHEAIGDAVLVVPAGMKEEADAIIASSCFRKKVDIVTGGHERWQSVLNGVRASLSEWVIVHDAARPFVTKNVIDKVLDKGKCSDCVITVTPEVDTIRMTSDDMAGEVVDRSKLVRVGTPQFFRRTRLLDALAAAPDLPNSPTDEAALMQIIGVPVAISWGDPANFKITTPADLAIAEAIIAHRT